jgi:hypothetical protein
MFIFPQHPGPLMCACLSKGYFRPLTFVSVLSVQGYVQRFNIKVVEDNLFYKYYLKIIRENNPPSLINLTIVL